MRTKWKDEMKERAKHNDVVTAQSYPPAGTRQNTGTPRELHHQMNFTRAHMAEKET